MAAQKRDKTPRDKTPGGVPVFQTPKKGFSLDTLSDDVDSTTATGPAALFGRSGRSVLKLDPNECFIDVNVRTHPDPQRIEELRHSIKQDGQKQPIVVGPKQENGYPVVMGQCRLLAVRGIPGKKIDAIEDADAYNLCRSDKIAIQIVENVQRQTLDLLELATGFSDMADDGVSQSDIARKVSWLTSEGKPDTSRVSRALRLASMPDEAKTLMRERIVTDLFTMDFLRKIHELDEQKFFALCQLVRDQGGISRSRARHEFNNLKHGTASEKTEKLATQTATDDGSTAALPDGPLDETANASAAGQSEENEKSSKTREKGAPASPGAAVKATLPVLHVDVAGKGSGTLCLSSTPEKDGWGYVVLESGERTHVAFDDVTIRRLAHV